MSNTNHELIGDFHQYLDRKEAFLDAYIDKGSEHDLFIASYIHGHFSVVAASLLNAINTQQIDNVNLTDLQAQTMTLLKQSIEKAIANQELAEQDAKDVLVMQETLFKQ